MSLVHDSAIGPLALDASPDGLTSCRFGAAGDAPRDGDTAVLDLARREIDAYLAGDLRAFTVPVDLYALPRDRPPRARRRSPRSGYGETTTYGALATAAGLELRRRPSRRRRAGAQPRRLVVPCHRVVGRRRRPHRVRRGAGSEAVAARPRGPRPHCLSLFRMTRAQCPPTQADSSLEHQATPSTSSTSWPVRGDADLITRSPAPARPGRPADGHDGGRVRPRCAAPRRRSGATTRSAALRAADRNISSWTSSPGRSDTTATRSCRAAPGGR